MYKIATFYKFFSIDNCEEWKNTLFEYCDSLEIKGTILLANEGINGTLSGSSEAISKLTQFYQEIEFLKDMRIQYSIVEESCLPFNRLKVKIKKEIVSLGINELKDIPELTGMHIHPKDWDVLIEDPNTLVIDVRNDYECRVGSFQGAINPQTDTFRSFPTYIEKELSDHKDKKIAIFCTGGIRCEKASAFLKKEGFQDVVQLDGGILNYLKAKEGQESKWSGECFVFDHRVTLDHSLNKGKYQQCFACRYPLTEAQVALDSYEPGVSCAHCIDQLTQEKKSRNRMKHQQRKSNR